MEFKNSKEYIKIKKELELNNIILKEFKFFNHVIYINDKKESEVRWSLSDKKWLKSFENSI